MLVQPACYYCQVGRQAGELSNPGLKGLSGEMSLFYGD